MSANGIAHLLTKELRQKAKLDLAASDRAAFNTGSNTRHDYDLTALPTQYVGNDIVNNLQEGGLKLGRPWVSFLPTDLFAAGEKGVWYDPNDITTLFQDVAGTIPVTTSGQKVALMKDKSGNNAHATQSTAAYRPTFYVYPDGVEYGCLQFDGATQFMVSSSINFTGTNKMTASVGLSVDSSKKSAGIRHQTFSGDWNGDPTFFNGKTATATVVSNNFTIASESTNTSEMYYGIFTADYTGTWTFSMISDDKAMLWIGDYAALGYTASNAVLSTNVNTVSVTISLVSGQSYPFRLMYGNGGGPGILNLTFAHTGQSATADFTGKVFYNTTGIPLELSATSDTNAGSFGIAAPSYVSDHVFSLTGTTNISARVNNEVLGDDVLTGVFDISQATKELEIIPRLSGIIPDSSKVVWGSATGSTSAGTGNFGTYPLYIGSRGGTASYFKGNIYGIVVRGTKSTDTQITNTEAWITSKLY